MVTRESAKLLCEGSIPFRASNNLILLQQVQDKSILNTSPYNCYSFVKFYNSFCHTMSSYDES